MTLYSIETALGNVTDNLLYNIDNNTLTQIIVFDYILPLIQ